MMIVEWFANILLFSYDTVTVAHLMITLTSVIVFYASLFLCTSVMCKEKKGLAIYRMPINVIPFLLMTKSVSCYLLQIKTTKLALNQTMIETL